MNRTVKITKAPFLRNSGTVQSLMFDMLVAMAFVYMMPIFFYGFRVLKNLVVSLAVCYFADLLVRRIRDGKYNFLDFSPLVTGAILPLLFPASIDIGIIVIADLFAILVVKHPFGGLGNNPFNPAAAAFCFAAISWSDKVFAYTKPMQWLSVFGSVSENVRFYETSAKSLGQGGKPLFDFFDVLVGNTPGAAGATSVIVILAAGAYLLYRKALSVQISAGVLIGASVFALVFPRASINVFEALWFEITSGVLIFGAVFMATEPVTSCKHPYAKWIYGLSIGVLTMLFRHFGKMEIAFPFALLIANSFTPFLDKIGTGIDRYTDLTPRLSKEERQAEKQKGGAENEA
ncbi:MAG: RnfABCDGE type electron transport complex subunit D [Oscillospiraceae bacterium]|nr:RnfABCDGE type electron transport complex subunit D [Oscillospiraceae bacterium]